MDKAGTPDAISFSPYSPPAAGPPRPAHAAGTVGGMLAEARRRLTERPFLLLAACLSVWLPVNLLATWLNLSFFGPVAPQGFYYLQLLLEVLIGTLGTGALIFAASPAGGVRTLGEALSRGAGSWGRLIAVRLLCFLAYFASLLACILPFFFVALRLCLAPYAATLEGLGGRAAIQRSWNLSRDRVGFLLRCMVVANGPMIVFSQLGTLAYLKGVDYLPVLDHPVVFEFLFAVVTLCLLAFSVVCLQVVFEDLVREEEAAAEATATAAGVEATVDEEPTPPPSI